MRTETGGLLTWGVFVRLLGVVYAVMFVSASGQALALFGSHGLEPVSELLRVVTEHVPAPYRYLRFPTLFWLSSSDHVIAAVPYSARSRRW